MILVISCYYPVASSNREIVLSSFNFLEENTAYSILMHILKNIHLRLEFFLIQKFLVQSMEFSS